MTQDKIIDGLLKALQNGKGDLDELDKLLDRAKTDIAEAKETERKAQEELMAKRGQNIAEMATRYLNDELTAEDTANVMNSFFGSRGVKVKFTPDELEQMAKPVDTKVLNEELDKAIDDLISLFADIGNKSKKSKPAAKPTVDRSADDVIADFLRKAGL